jgi:tRNA (cytidine56-2'-O)-methyltransferase
LLPRAEGWLPSYIQPADNMGIHVLRLSHRAFRDKRISTHCALVSRAFGAEKMIYSGERDHSMEESIRKVVKQWGGKFSVEYAHKWSDVIKAYKRKKWLIIHLTMYGLPVQNEIPKICRKNTLLVFGGEKVPMEVYHLADFNVSVTSQPHSEVAAIAIFLHEYFRGKELRKCFPGGKRIVPQRCGKKFTS